MTVTDTHAMPEKPPHIVAHEQAMLDRFGYTPTSMVPCPRVLATRTCYARAWDGAPSTRPNCLCLRSREILDHARLWHDRDGRRVLTAEPYGLTADVLSTFVAECRALGLWVTVAPDSLWCPGAAVLVTIRRRTPATYARGVPRVPLALPVDAAAPA